MRALISVMVIGGLLWGCASTPELSPMQRRAIQTRTFENASYESVFRAFKTILQDEGYIIKNQDMQGGLIVATIQHTARGGAFFAAFSGNPNYRVGEGFEISINLEKVSNVIVESRLTIQKLEQYSMGGQQGRVILDPELYASFYNKVRTEIERRKAKGKG